MLAGRTAPGLLATYNAERRPVAWVRYQQTFARPDYAAYVPADMPKEPLLSDSAAVLGAGPELPPAERPDQWAGQPGTRAPHLWITRHGKRLSTLDLFQPGWVLLANDAAWVSAAARVAAQLGLNLTCVRFGADIGPAEPGALPTAFGLGAGGASLVRPDGYIAWRTVERPAAPQAALLAALSQVAFAGSGQQ